MEGNDHKDPEAQQQYNHIDIAIFYAGVAHALAARGKGARRVRPPGLPSRAGARAAAGANVHRGTAPGAWAGERALRAAPRPAGHVRRTTLAAQHAPQWHAR